MTTSELQEFLRAEAMKLPDDERLVLARDLMRSVGDERYLAAIDEGLADADAGHLHDGGDVFAQLRLKLESLRPRP
jgi:predicted transcriptional regulator